MAQIFTFGAAEVSRYNESRHETSDISAGVHSTCVIVWVAAWPARTGRPFTGWRIPSQQRLAAAAGRPSDSARYFPDERRPFSRREISAGVERGIQAAVDQRHRHRLGPGDGNGAGGGRLAGPDVFAARRPCL